MTELTQAMEWLCLRAAEMGITLSDAQIAQFQAFYTALTEKNKVMNLTAITEPYEVAAKHFLDSLSLVRAYVPKETDRILDMGTGGGFPGIPLKIAFPETEIVLADSLNKRIKFLNEVIDNNQYKKITAVHARAEELARKSDYREQFDLVVSRAVANLSTLCEYCLPYVKIGGAFISYKSGEVEEELNQAKKAISMLGGKCQKVEAFSLPGTEYERTLVVIKKVKETPNKYPRKAGLPSKEPLGA